jgi:dephospho-CoA kinase|tara:strand:+ start:1610 stop:2218 length:609 start_codon:yes stop_codon:yes gene_type:complete
MLAQEDIGLNEINISFTLLSSIMLIGLTGRNASGKSTLVNWFAEKGLRSVSCSDSIREWLKNQNKQISRDSLIEGGRTLRKEGGGGILAEMLLEIIDGADAVVDSIRTPMEVDVLRSRGDLILIEIKASEDRRWSRLQDRARPGDPVNKLLFIKQENKEIKSKDEAGQALDATALMADIQITNDGTIDDLYLKLDKIWEESN